MAQKSVSGRGSTQFKRRKVQESLRGVRKTKAEEEDCSTGRRRPNSLKRKQEAGRGECRNHGALYHGTVTSQEKGTADTGGPVEEDQHC